MTALAQATADVSMSPSLRADTRVHLRFLDGIRGFSALYVVVGHIVESARLDEVASTSLARAAFGVFRYGYAAVVAFIVLSGYCLMLPVVRSPDQRLLGGIATYLRRRSIRILPPYYAALLLSLVIIAVIPGLKDGVGASWDKSLPAFAPQAILPHLLLIHNFSRRWIGLINCPMWSVATEWQIYFLFPFLLPLWGRAGIVPVLSSGLLVGIAGGALIGGSLQEASPFPALFTFGVASAAVTYSSTPFCVRLRTSIPWPSVTLVIALGLALIFVGSRGFIREHLVTGELVIGCVVASSIIALADPHARPIRWVRTLRWILSSAPAAMLGTFSYSLYLIHFPIIGAVLCLVQKTALSPQARALAVLALSLPASLVAASLFYLAIERPCILFRKPLSAANRPR